MHDRTHAQDEKSTKLYVHYPVRKSYNPVSSGTFGNMLVFCGGELLDPCPTVGLEDHPMSAARLCVFGVLAVVAHIWRPSVSLAA